MDGSSAQLTRSDQLFAELVVTALAAERQLRPYVGELGADPMLFRGFSALARDPAPLPLRPGALRSPATASASSTPA